MNSPSEPQLPNNQEAYPSEEGNPNKDSQQGYRILYYVSSHGYGHISRSYEVIKSLLHREDVSLITLCTERLNFIREEHPKLEKRSANVDVGVIQKDSLSLDVKLTKDALKAFEKNKLKLIDEELAFARDKNYDIIITDSSSLPLVLAVSLEIPGIFLGNFTWDFIYRNFSKYDPYFQIISDILEVEYSFATAALLLPFACPTKGFLESYPIGLVGRKPLLNREEARSKYGFRDDELYFLFSFGAYGLDGIKWDWDALSPHWHIVASGLPSFSNERIMEVNTDHYPDLVRACDYVVTKPGYGILSESILAGTPIIYTDRGDFAEYPYLVDELEDKFLASYISREDLMRFSFEKCLTEIKNKTELSKEYSFGDGLKDIQKFIANYLN